MGAALLIRYPQIVLIRHEGNSFRDLLRNRKKKARPVLRNLKRSDRHDDAILSCREKATRSDDRIISAVFHSENNVSDLTYNLVVGTADFRSDHFVRPQAGGKFVNSQKWLGVFFVTTAQRGSTFNFGFARDVLLIGLFL